jgi:hypothetical protein
MGEFLFTYLITIDIHLAVVKCVHFFVFKKITTLYATNVRIHIVDWTQSITATFFLSKLSMIVS